MNIVFADGTRLFEPHNFRLRWPIQSQYDTILPSSGETRSYDLLIPPELDLTLKDIAELYVRKEDDDGWFVGSILLYANGISTPLIGNRHVNQFLDNDTNVLRLKDWSTKSMCVAQATRAKFPLLPSGYRILGPVIGPVSDRSAKVYLSNGSGRHLSFYCH